MIRDDNATSKQRESRKPWRNLGLQVGGESDLIGRHAEVLPRFGEFKFQLYRGPEICQVGVAASAPA